jgi:hypothetical protein
MPEHTAAQPTTIHRAESKLNSPFNMGDEMQRAR